MKYLDRVLNEYKAEFELNLIEGLFKTTPVGQTVSIIKRKFPNWRYQYQKGTTAFEINTSDLTTNEYKELLVLLNNLGYYISYINIQNKYKGKPDNVSIINSINDSNIINITLDCEAKYDFKVNKIPAILYHVCTTKNLNKILKVGLIPKSKSKIKYHPDRIYVTKTIEAARKLILKLGLSINITDWTILEINTELIPHIELYEDPNYKSHGYYTLNNIPAYSIKIIDEKK